MGRMKQVRRIKLLLVISFVVLSGTAFMPSMSFAEKDSGKSFEEYLSLAKQGDAEAQLHLGNMYKKGKGVPKDYKEAVRWYRKAAEQGEAVAQYKLGEMYYSGYGVPEYDLKEAVRWYRKAAEQGEAHAQMELGYMYRMGYDGEGVPQNYKEAVRWYRKAAEQGYVRTQYTLGVMYRDGEGVPKDLVASYAWLNISAAQGYKDFLDEVRASELRDRVAKKLPAAALAIAQELSMEYYKKYVEPFQ
jgi:hypothetical protein